MRRVTFNGHLNESKDVEYYQYGQNNIQLPGSIYPAIGEGKEVNHIILISAITTSHITLFLCAKFLRGREKNIVITIRIH